MTVERMTTAEAVVRFLIAQQIDDERDGVIKPLFPGVFAIFGHGNALGLGEALHTHRSRIRTIRGQNEEGMALAAVAYAKASRRRQVMAVTTSIGPGALNTVPAAGVAMANRLPLLLLLGDTFASRMPDPVLQQIETFSNPTVTANDALIPVSRYWDRITRPSQLLSALPQAVAILLDPEDTGPVTLALPQDVQAEAYDFPTEFFKPRIHRIVRIRPDTTSVQSVTKIIKSAKRPLIIAGGGVHYSLAESELQAFAAKHRIPVMETVAGKSSLIDSDPMFAGPIGVFAESPGLQIARNADVVISVGTRLQDFTTESGTVFRDSNVKMVSINVGRFDAHKRGGFALIGDAKATLSDLSGMLGDWAGPKEWAQQATDNRDEQRGLIQKRATAASTIASYAQVVHAVEEVASADDYVVTSSGGLAGEAVMNWRSKSVASFDCEYGFSCMGYEISGGWGAALERSQSNTKARVYALAGDGSFMMLPIDIYSAVLTGLKNLSIVVCDNHGFNVIERLQINHGSPSFKTMLADEDHPNPPRINFAAIAGAMGAIAHVAQDLDDLQSQLRANRQTPGVHVYVIEVAKHYWSEGESFWEVGIPESSSHPEVHRAYEKLVEGKSHQRQVWNAEN